MRNDSSNVFAAAPPSVPFRECPFSDRPELETLELAEGTRVAASDWLPDVGGVALISDETSRFSHQELFFVTTTGTLQPLPLPSSLRSPVNEVHLVRRAELLLVIGEAWGTTSDLGYLMEEAFGEPDSGDLVVMDLDGVQRARHRSAHSALLSPDHRWMAYWRSGDDGLHNLLVARPEQRSALFVAAIVEADPGSGMSFSACWSADSRYLHVSGASEGWQPIRWTYDVVRRELYGDVDGTR